MWQALRPPTSHVWFLYGERLVFIRGGRSALPLLLLGIIEEGGGQWITVLLVYFTKL